MMNRSNSENEPQERILKNTLLDTQTAICTSFSHNQKSWYLKIYENDLAPIIVKYKS